MLVIALLDIRDHDARIETRACRIHVKMVVSACRVVVDRLAAFRRMELVVVTLLVVLMAETTMALAHIAEALDHPHQQAVHIREAARQSRTAELSRW